ncbi:MAG: hypothetical protein JNK33_04345 [Candidatus Doudnabacteria bacterium]|nr:hypothetical protein [Candidatus Doudnabacteria bacterium]
MPNNCEFHVLPALAKHFSVLPNQNRNTNPLQRKLEHNSEGVDYETSNSFHSLRHHRDGVGTDGDCSTAHPNPEKSPAGEAGNHPNRHRYQRQQRVGTEKPANNPQNAVAGTAVHQQLQLGV